MPAGMCEVLMVATLYYGGMSLESRCVETYQQCQDELGKIMEDNEKFSYMGQCVSVGELVDGGREDLKRYLELFGGVDKPK